MSWSPEQSQKGKASFEKAVERFVSNADDVNELAFHFSEMSEEIIEMAEFIKQLRLKRSCTEAELIRFQQCMCYHWPSHQEGIKSILEKGIFVEEKEPNGSGKDAE